GDVAAAVAGLDDEEPAEPVDVAAALGVPDVDALALGDHRDLRPVLVGGVPGEVHPEVVAGGVRESLDVVASGCLLCVRAHGPLPVAVSVVRCPMISTLTRKSQLFHA